MVPDGAQSCWAEGILRQQLKRLENCAHRDDSRLTMKSQLIAIVAVTAIGLSFTQLVVAEEHHEEYADEIARQVVEVEVNVLLEKYSEIMKRFHQLDLERINLEVEIELASNETEQSEVSRQLKRIHLLQDRLQDKRHQTRDELFHVSHQHHEENEGHEEDEHEEEYREEETEHSEAQELENELHHLHQEIEDFREAGKLDRAEQLELKAKELLEEFESREHRKGEREPDEAEFNQHFEQIMEERREAIAHLEELSEALEQFEGEGEEAEAERDRLEERTDEAESHVDKLNEKLERLESIRRK